MKKYLNFRFVVDDEIHRNYKNGVLKTRLVADMFERSLIAFLRQYPDVPDEAYGTHGFTAEKVEL